MSIDHTPNQLLIFTLLNSPQLCKALLRRHRPSMLDRCSGDAYRLLHQRTCDYCIPTDLRRWEEGRLLKAQGDKTVEISPPASLR